MRSLIRELARHATVIISTHILQEVEAICARVLIMRAGRLALDSDLGEIGARPRLLVTLDRGPDEVRGLLGAVEGVTDVAHLGDDGLRRRYALSAADPAAIAPRVASDLAGQGWALYGLEQERRDLEALFGAVSGGSAVFDTAGADAEETADV
jgi:ABC-2 type transport system ATP-binding protein